MTGILILLGMNIILWKILVKLMFAKQLAGQNFLPCPALAALQGKQGRAAGQPYSVTVSVFYANMCFHVEYPRNLLLHNQAICR
jgi:hypothetical protein